MQTIHLVSHTHWDREWYLPFQHFRLKLVQLVDDLLALMDSGPDYRTFMLDGQTIVLEDYLQMRPEKEQKICELVQAGRLLIGPWHVLPDEFLVSPESLIRNLLTGERVSRRFGPKMQLGYIPDPFGHIGQMPQILRGFDIDSACLQRGLDDQPCEFWWQAPDGSRVLLVYMRDGYGNAALLPAEPGDDFVKEVRRLSASLAPYCQTPNILLMQGTDHMPAVPATAAAIEYARDRLDGARLVHSTLPAYLQAVKTALQKNPVELPVITGELRSSKRFHLLPGVLSARTWIKQRNHACETVLEKWAEPFSTLATLLLGDPQPGSGRLTAPDAVLRQAWHLLLENQPHDSICGCSIDQVHREMAPRFDQVEQIGEQIVLQSLEALAAETSTLPPSDAAFADTFASVVVYNAAGGEQTGMTEFLISLPSSAPAVEVLDDSGAVLPAQVIETTTSDLTTLVMDRDQLSSMLASVNTGSIANVGPIQGMTLQDARFERRGHTLYIYATLSRYGRPDEAALQHALEEFTQYLPDQELTRFVLQARTRFSRVRFLARGVPPFGCRTFWLRPASRQPQPQSEAAREIENEFFHLRLEDDGTLTLLDKRSGARYSGLNRFVDGGDCGDEYNFSPPAQDLLLSPELHSARVQRSEMEQSLEVELHMAVPAGLTADRQSRAPERLPLRILSRITLLPGLPRVDIHTRVENPAGDHRLRVHFPAPIETDHADYDGHFEIVRRPLALPEFDSTWAEDPRPEKPQRNFTTVSDGYLGLTVSSRGLREVEVIPSGTGQTEIALTLLRCVGWLSREDFSTRRGHAGPGLPTPEAQMIGAWSFEYALIPHTGGWEQALGPASGFQTPLRAASRGLHAGRIPACGSFLQVEPQTFAISALKAPEEGPGAVLRGYNLLDRPQTVILKPGWSFRTAELAALSERPLQALPVSPDGSITFEAGPKQIVTLRIR